MAKQSDISAIKEVPADDPAVKAETPSATAAVVVDLPKVEKAEAPPKVSPRVMFIVTATYGKDTFGPFEQEAVDESEAIQRVLDGPNGGALKALAVSAQFRAKRKKV